MTATLLHVDARKRITLPPETRVNTGEDLEMEILEDGRIILTPIVRIPRSQIWAWDREVDELLREAAADKSPMTNMSGPGALESLRERLGVKSN